MGITLSINNILRQDIDNLQLNHQYPFQKDGLHHIADNIQIWLTKKDWTVLADIQVISQQRKDNQTSGVFLVKYLYSGEEQRTLTQIFRRMYGWQ